MIDPEKVAPEPSGISVSILESPRVRERPPSIAIPASFIVSFGIIRNGKKSIFALSNPSLAS